MVMVAGAGLPALSDVSGGFTFPRVDIRGCSFVNNVENINISSQVSLLRDNVIGFNKSNTMTHGIDLRASGGGNMITANHLGGTYKTFANAGFYEGVAGDDWAGNYSADLAAGSVDAATGITWKDPAA